MLAREQLSSGTSLLDLRVATTGSRPTLDHVLLLVHGLPRVIGMGRQAVGTLPELAEHVANETGWTVACGSMSGVGSSTGTFSVGQWRRDLAAFVDRLVGPERKISLCGFGLGGTIALATAAHDDRVRGVATFAAPCDLARWAVDGESLAESVRSAGVVDPAEPLHGDDVLLAEVLELDPRTAAAALPPRRFLIGHGSDDPEVPVEDARELLEAADGRAELRIIQGAGHWLRADPRMVATLLGWLDRHR